MAVSKKPKKTVARRLPDAPKLSRPATLAVELVAPAVYKVEGSTIEETADGWYWSIAGQPWRKDAATGAYTQSVPGGRFLATLPLGNSAQVRALAEYITAQELALGIAQVDGAFLKDGAAKCASGAHRVKPGVGFDNEQCDDACLTALFLARGKRAPDADADADDDDADADGSDPLGFLANAEEGI